MKKRILAGAAIIGLILMLLVVLDFTELPVALLLFKFLNPSLLAVTGLVLISFWLLTAPGYKRAPFILTFLSGAALILISLEYGFKIPGALDSLKGRLYVTGILLLLGSRLTSLRHNLNIRRFFPAFVLTLTSLIVLVINLESTPFDRQVNLSYQDGVDLILAAFSPVYRESDELKKYLNDLLQDDSLKDEDREMLVGDLRLRIAVLEKEMNQFEQMKEENRKYQRQIDEMNQRIGTVSLCPGVTEDSAMVATYREAVRPSKPCVRDFAVTLAKEHPGSYYRSGSGEYSPGKEGIAQIIAIHQYLSGNWKYVNDPLFVSRDYYSPADRTLAVGLAGDCDDFAIIMASSIEAIGGRVRIVYGTCNEGAHAWAEVFIGKRTVWDETLRQLEKSRPDARISGYVKDTNGNYWLSLDWQIGQYSCGNNPLIQYRSLK